MSCILNLSLAWCQLMGSTLQCWWKWMYSRRYYNFHTSACACIYIGFIYCFSLCLQIVFDPTVYSFNVDVTYLRGSKSPHLRHFLFIILPPGYIISSVVYTHLHNLLLVKTYILYPSSIIHSTKISFSQFPSPILNFINFSSSPKSISFPHFLPLLQAFHYLCTKFSLIFNNILYLFFHHYLFSK